MSDVADCCRCHRKNGIYGGSTCRYRVYTHDAHCNRTAEISTVNERQRADSRTRILKLHPTVSESSVQFTGKITAKIEF